MISAEYKAILESIRIMAEQSSGIEAVFVIGSCARTIEKADEYSDLDLLIITNDLQYFLTGQEWISRIYNPLCVFHDHEPGQISNDIRVLFDNFLEVDFVFFETGHLQTEWIAHFCLNTYMKKRLIKIIEASEKEDHGKDYNTWFEGRFIEKWANSETVEKLKDCFSGYSKNEILEALKHNIELFKALAEKVCIKRGIDFPKEEVNRILHHIGIRQQGG